MVEGKEAWLSKSHIPPFIYIFHPVPSTIVHRALLFICHHGMQNATDPEERTPHISCNTPPFTVIFWHVSGLVLSYIFIPRDKKCPSRQLVCWFGQALVPNVGEHVILLFGANGHWGPYQSHSSVTAILWFISSRSIEINSAIHIVFSLYFCWALYYLPYLYHYRLRT